jgi:hypothetical protein
MALFSSFRGEAFHRFQGAMMSRIALLVVCLALAGCGVTVIDLGDRPAEGIVYRR